MFAHGSPGIAAGEQQKTRLLLLPGATRQRRDWPTVAATYHWTFLDHNQGWMTTVPDMTSACGCGDSNVLMKPVDFEVLFHTPDGGQHWQKVAQLPSQNGIDSLIFTDAHNGWLSAEIDDPKPPFPDLYHYPLLRDNEPVRWRQ